MTENKEMKTEQEYIKIQLSDISPGPRVDYMHTLYGDENLVGTHSIPLGQLTRGQLTSCDEVVICSMYTAGNNIEDVCLMNNTCKKDDNNNMTENKDFEIKDLISLANIMIENNLDYKEAKVEQERLKNTYFKPIYTRFECEEEEEELPSDIDFQVGWSMKQTVTRAGDIATTLSYKKPNPVEIKSMNIKNNLNIV